MALGWAIPRSHGGAAAYRSVETARHFELFSFFFSSRRRHTRFDCDWSSDVCSSDLLREPLGSAQQRAFARFLARRNTAADDHRIHPLVCRLIREIRREKDVGEAVVVE